MTDKQNTYKVYDLYQPGATDFSNREERGTIDGIYFDNADGPTKATVYCWAYYRRSHRASVEYSLNDLMRVLAECEGHGEYFDEAASNPFFAVFVYDHIARWKRKAEMLDWRLRFGLTHGKANELRKRVHELKAKTRALKEM